MFDQKTSGEVLASERSSTHQKAFWVASMKRATILDQPMSLLTPQQSRTKMVLLAKMLARRVSYIKKRLLMGTQWRGLGTRRRSGRTSPGYLCHRHKSWRDHVTNTWNRKKMGNLAKILAGHFGKLGIKRDRISSGARYSGDSQWYGVTPPWIVIFFFGLRFPHLLITLPSGNYTSNIMSFNFKRHNNTYKILQRHNSVLQNCMTFLCHKF